jgi:uncharacterized protein
MLWAMLAGLILFVSHAISAATGFGSNVLALPLLAMVVGLAAGKAALIVLNTLLYLYLGIRWRRHVSLRRLVVIVSLGAAGIPAGIWLFEWLPEKASMVTLGLFVSGFGLLGLIDHKRLLSLPRVLARALLFLGGVVHGAFTTGGPLLVIYAHQTIRHKASFRATLAVMWIVLNTALMVGWTLTRTWPEQTLHVTLIGLLPVAGGLITGEYIHHKIDPAAFDKAVNGTLIVTGLVLTVTTLLKG